MTDGRYLIPAQRHRIDIVDRRSRFVSTVDCSPTVDVARALIESVKGEMPDATHHVYAFAVGFGGSVTHGMSDAGEPSGTAGRPTLAVVQGSGLGDVCVITTRYFGGTKLGTGGLVRAYTRAAQLVLAEVPRVERIENMVLALSVPYPMYESISHLIQGHGGRIDSAEFAGDVAVTFALAADRLPEFEEAIAAATSGRVTATVIRA